MHQAPRIFGLGDCRFSEVWFFLPICLVFSF
jgi:hypothetical protein